MQTADSTTRATILGYFPEKIQVALRAYADEIYLSVESLVKLAIGYFLESAEIQVDMNDQDPLDVLPDQGMLSYLPHLMQKGIDEYATEYEFPPEFVVEMAVTFLLDPDASSFDDCQVNVHLEQVYLLQEYRKTHQAEAA